MKISEKREEIFSYVKRFSEFLNAIRSKWQQFKEYSAIIFPFATSEGIKFLIRKADHSSSSLKFK